MSVRVFVGNIPYSITEAQLREHFAAVAGVSEVQIIRDRNTQHSRGFGFIDVMTEEDAEHAVTELHGQVLGDKALRVERANERDQRPRRNGRNRRG